MRFTFAAAVFSAVLSTATAANIFARQSFPSCANSCVLTPSNTFGCGATDDTCLCNNAQYIQATTQCIVSSCDAADAQSAEQLSQQLCLQVGVTLTSTPALTSSGTPSSTQNSAASSTPSGSSTGSGSAPASSATSPSGSSSGASSPSTAASTSASSSSSGAPAPSGSSSAASATGANAFIGLAAVLLAALNF